jgi:hypothetical protein
MSTYRFPQSRPGELRILTLNLWGRNGAWTDRRSVLIERFHALQPNLVALQEVIRTNAYNCTTRPVCNRALFLGGRPGIDLLWRYPTSRLCFR